MSKEISIDDLYRKCKSFGIGNFDEYTKNINQLKELYPNTVTDSSNIVSDNIYAFCNEHFGDNWIWATPIGWSITTMIFKNEEDMLFFKLKFK